MAEEKDYSKYFDKGIKKNVLNDKSKIKLTLAVVSGKGGVGKSLVTSLLASKLSREGFKVGILDADVTGPSIPKTFGIDDLAYGQDNMIFPSISKGGIKIISSNMLMEDKEAPILWRSSLVCSLINQFYKDVLWGELDVLLIDMPPGTSDVNLQVYQTIPVDGVIVVTSPQDLVTLIVKKSIGMAEQMNIPVLGIVENMSYVLCPNCEEKIYIYGHNNDSEFKNRFNYERLAAIPFDSQLVRYVDEGQIEFYEQEYLDNVFNKIVDRLGDKDGQ